MTDEEIFLIAGGFLVVLLAAWWWSTKTSKSKFGGIGYGWSGSDFTPGLSYTQPVSSCAQLSGPTMKEQTCRLFCLEGVPTESFSPCYNSCMKTGVLKAG